VTRLFRSQQPMGLVVQALCLCGAGALAAWALGQPGPPSPAALAAAPLGALLLGCGLAALAAGSAGRRDAERSLRESEALYRRAIAAAGAVVYQLDFSTESYTHVDAGIHQLTGVPASDFTHQRWDQLLHSVTMQGAAHGLPEEEAERRFRTGELPVWQADYQIQTPDGRIRWLTDSSVAIRNARGEVVGTLGILQDITGRKEAEASLADRENLLRTVIDSDPHAVTLISPELKLMQINRSGLELMEAGSVEEALARADGSLVAPGHRDAVRAVMDRALEGHPGEIEFEMVSLKGTRRTLEMQAVPLRDQSGTVTAVLTIARDVTEHRRLEAQLLHAQKMESIGRLAGGVAHDFNNLLTAILGYTELAASPVRDNPDAAAVLDAVRQAGERAAALTGQLLGFAQRQMAEPRVLDLNERLLEVDRLLRRIVGEDVEIVTLPCAEIWPVRIDPGQFEQVVVNLAVNARDAMPGGGKLTIRTECVTVDAEVAAWMPEFQAGDYVLLSVSDTGVGIAPEAMPHIFEPFFTTKKPGQGTGLGLSTCYGIVKRNGGHISASSVPGAGTTMRVWLPRAPDPAAAAPQPHPPAASGAETLLLVEDEPLVRDIAVRILTDSGYHVLHAGTGSEALVMALEHPGDIHMLVTDVVMPHMSGVQLAERFRDIRPEARVLFTSGYTDGAVLHGGSLGQDAAFLQKPYSAAALAGKVREVLDSPRDQAGPTGHMERNHPCPCELP